MNTASLAAWRHPPRDDDALGRTSAGHPSPQRRNVGLLVLAVGLVAAPLAWAGALLVAYSTAAYACYPGRHELASPLWQALPGVLDAVAVIAFVIGLVGAGFAWRSWRRTRGEQAGSAHALLEVGEGRSRFLAMAGLLVSLLFVVATIFVASGLWLVTPCAR